MPDLIEWFLGTPVKIAVIILLAFLLRIVLIRASSRVIKRALLLRRDRAKQSGNVQNESAAQDRYEQRARSISQLLRSVISATVWSLAAIMALSNLGIEEGSYP